MSLRTRSTRSGRSPSTPSSILKKPKTIQGRLSDIKKPSVKVKFTLPHSQKVQSILQDYVSKQQSREYENILCLIRDSELTDEDISALLKEATECISLLNKDLRLFIEAILTIEWSDKSEGVVSEYQSFIVNLLSAHNYHTKIVIEKLVKLFLPDPVEQEWLDGDPNEVDLKKCSNVHTLLKMLLEVVPMSRELFLKSVCNQFPYYNRPVHTHEYYIHNVLNILRYQPNVRYVILELLFKKLVIMDVNAPREEIVRAKFPDEEMFVMDEDVKSVKSSRTDFTKVNRHELAHSLDVCLEQVFQYIHNECLDCNDELNYDRSKILFDEILTAFEHVILPTYDTHHVQYIIFYLCSFNKKFAENFVFSLWKYACNPNKAPILRQAAVNYLASFTARANYLSIKLVKMVLSNLSEWIQSYISTQDELGPVNSDFRIHRVFYSACQALFYIVAFRHKDFVESAKKIMFLQNLNMSRIVTSKLNPLRVCQPAVVQNFAAIARNYQLAYCYTVVEHNSRNKLPTVYRNEQGSLVTYEGGLDAVFPFDSYLLERSGKRIFPIHREYQELSEESSMEVDNNKETDVDDFLYNHDASSASKFSYSTSPGFKFKF